MANNEIDQSLSFGKWLQQRRKSLDLTQDELATRLGFSVSVVRVLEQNQRVPTKEQTKRLTEVLGIEPE
jgi:transcriptional regulator with XRE-family HTH domain